MTGPATNPRGQAIPDRPRRGKELVLLVAATVIVGFSLLIVQLAQEQELSLSLLWITLAFLGLTGVAHLGFQVKFIARIDRPTPLVHGLRRWLEVFSASHTDGFTSEQKDAFYKEVEDYCRPMLYSEQNGWTADYVRLRFLAVKPEE